MADVDEDVIPRSRGGSEENDLTDETQDFRFLSSISREDASIPKRGEKDFEPHSTALQSNTLAASRQAMHNALAFQRTHQPRAYTTAIYHPDTNMAYAYNPKGVLFSKIGFVMSKEDDPFGRDEMRGHRVWLLPEEVLYLIERGSLDVRWPAVGDEIETEGLAMSLQGAYAVFIGNEASHEGALTFERFTVYSGLKRMGYVVHRAPSWDEDGPRISHACYSPKCTWTVGLSEFLRDHIWSSQGQNETQRQACGPLVESNYYRSYAEIYRRLALINSHDPTSRLPPAEPATANADDASFRITFHVWKPGNQNYKKSDPGPPDFRIAVVNARETAIPTLEQLGSLMDTLPYDPPMESASMYQKLKHGHKNVVLAIVDQGVVSYLRVMDAGFGREKLYERQRRPRGGKRGGRGGGRGRGN